MPKDIVTQQRFRAVMDNLERLATLRNQYLDASINVSDIGKLILQKTDVLVASHVVVTTVDCLCAIERLGAIRVKISEGTESMQDCTNQSYYLVESHLHDGGILDNIMKVKLRDLVRVCESESESVRMEILRHLARLAGQMPDSSIHAAISDTVRTLTQSMCPWSLVSIIAFPSNHDIFILARPLPA